MDESRVVLQRQRDQTRDDLVDAFERARAVDYQRGSAQLVEMQAADLRYRHARSLWQDPCRPDADLASSGESASLVWPRAPETLGSTLET